MTSKSTDKDAPITIKKYANRRLYNTATSSYVTLDHLCDMVKEGVDFVVYDAKSGDDITRSVLTQIIFEEESKGQNLLPIRFLRQLITFYGDSLQSFVPGYLDMSMEAFARNQEEIRKRMSQAWGGAQTSAFKEWEEQTRQSMALMQNAFRMFSPFAAPGAREAEGEIQTKTEAPKSAETKSEIDDLKQQLLTMQRQLNELSGGAKPKQGDQTDDA